MKRKMYRATVINNGKVENMIVSGYNKPSVKKELTDFFIKTNQIKDYRKFSIYLTRVRYINGDYMGNYYMCASIEVGEERINIADIEKAQSEVFSRINENMPFDDSFSDPLSDAFCAGTTFSSASPFCAARKADKVGTLFSSNL